MSVSRIPAISAPMSRREMRVVGPALIVFGLAVIALGVMSL